MKIVLAHNLYEPFAKGGAEKVVKKMANDFITQGNQVVIITTKPKSKKYLEEETVSPNLKIYRISSFYLSLSQKNKFQRLMLLSNNFCNFKKRYYFSKILKEEKPQLLITHNLIGLGFFLNNIAASLKIEHEHFLHDIQLLHPSGLMMIKKEGIINSLSARIFQSLTKKYFLKTKKIISPSNWLLKLHQENGFFKNKESEIRPLKIPGKDLKKELNLEEINKDGINKRNRNFLFVGQLEKHKGLLFLIKVFKDLDDKEAKLVIVGAGKDEEEAKEMAKDDQRIVFLGYLVTEDIRNLSFESRALIVPSLCYENSPTVIYEANEVGLKVIASDIGGISEIIKKDDVLFKAGDENDLLKKLQKEIF